MTQQLATLIPARVRKWVYAAIGAANAVEFTLDGFGYGLIPAQPQAAAVAVLSVLGFGLAFTQTSDHP